MEKRCTAILTSSCMQWNNEVEIREELRRRMQRRRTKGLRRELMLPFCCMRRKREAGIKEKGERTWRKREGCCFCMDPCKNGRVRRE
jgi:hypothetical protein